MQAFTLSTALVLLAALEGARAGFSSSSKSNVAVYWGQNSYGQSSGSLEQQNLATYCADSNIDIIPLAFATNIHGTGGEPEVNFANSGNDCSTFSGTALLDCPQIGDDIATCQQTYGKSILLSIGGATYSEGGFSSESDAVAGAQLIWDTFGPSSANASALRPFGDSAVDGFDFDFESTVSNMVPFANQLRSLMDADTASTGKTWLLSAAPQCPFPDSADDPMLSGGVSFDIVWVQFYNNYCGLQSFTAGSSTQNNFNFDTWDNWATNTSANKNVKVMLGAPANTGAAGSGYEDPDTLNTIIQYCEQFSSFGGVMLWDASQAYANTGFLSSLKTNLNNDASTKKRRSSRARAHARREIGVQHHGSHF